ncbi:MAG: TolB family protein [Anaerolineae bacterium]|jgi:hypothetical protein
MKFKSLVLALVLTLLLLAMAGCGQPSDDAEPTATPDIALLETRTEAQLAARLTAIAPEPTPTATEVAPLITPEPTARPTATPTPAPTVMAPPLLIVNVLQNGSANIVVPGWAGVESVLTHYAETMSISALHWLAGSDLVTYVSSHEFAYSRTNETNVFSMRADGSEQHMITGQYLPPDQASGPFVSLHGRVEGAAGVCHVVAQGMASLVDTDDTGAFVLEGVSQSAGWARAVCPQDERVYQGSVSIDAAVPDQEIVITVAPEGQGWRDASFAPDGQRFVGTFYRWKLDDQGEVRFELQGLLYDTAEGEYGRLEIPEGKTFHGAAWSPDGERIVGSLTDEEMAYLWQWDAQGASVGELYHMENSEEEVLTFMNAAWSADGAALAFEVHRWYWWSPEKFRTDLWRVDANGENASALLEVDWGTHATRPSWGAMGTTLFYQLSTSETDLGGLMPTEADIWAIKTDTMETVRWTEDGKSFLPAVRPDGGF